jgi:hypothetical protein
MECPNEGCGSASIAAGEEGQRLDSQPHCKVHGNQMVHKGQERCVLEKDSWRGEVMVTPGAAADDVSSTVRLGLPAASHPECQRKGERECRAMLGHASMEAPLSGSARTWDSG